MGTHGIPRWKFSKIPYGRSEAAFCGVLQRRLRGIAGIPPLRPNAMVVKEGVEGHKLSSCFKLLIISALMFMINNNTRDFCMRWCW